MTTPITPAAREAAEKEVAGSLLRHGGYTHAKDCGHYAQSLLSDRDAEIERLRKGEKAAVDLRCKLIDLLHKHGTGETDERDGEQIDQMVERIVSERDSLRQQLASMSAELAQAKEELAALKQQKP